MTLRTRRMIYISFFAIFFLIVPVLILYAIGYRYNFAKNTIEKTGILVVQTSPRAAVATINDRQGKKTPARYNHLLPDQYNVTVQKDGYYPWSKEVIIKSGLTTFAADIALFKQSTPQLLIDGEINIFSVNTRREKILYSKINTAGQEELVLLDLPATSQRVLATYNPKSYESFSFVSWSPNDTLALIKQETNTFANYFVVNTRDYAIIDFFNFSRTNFEQIKWDVNQDTTLYALADSVIYSINLHTATVETVRAENIKDFVVSNDRLYFVSTDGVQSLLNYLDLNNPTSVPKKIKLPSPASYDLSISPRGQIILLDHDHGAFFALEHSAFDALKIEENVFLQATAQSFYWQQENNNIIYFTDYELWAYETHKQQHHLINRFSKPIKKAQWLTPWPYIIYQLDNEIHAIEAVATTYKNDYTLAQCDNLIDFSLDWRYQNIYYKCLNGDQSGIYLLTIR